MASFAELFGALAIWFQGSLWGLLGALTLLGTSIGAIFCHLIWDKWKDGIATMITGSLSGFIVWTNRDIVPDFIDLSQLFLIIERIHDD